MFRAATYLAREPVALASPPIFISCIPPHACCRAPVHDATESRRPDTNTPDSKGAESLSPRADACGPAARRKLTEGRTQGKWLRGGDEEREGRVGGRERAVERRRHEGTRRKKMWRGRGEEQVCTHAMLATSPAVVSTPDARAFAQQHRLGMWAFRLSSYRCRHLCLFRADAEFSVIGSIRGCTPCMEEFSAKCPARASVRSRMVSDAGAPTEPATLQQLTGNDAGEKCILRRQLLETRESPSPRVSADGCGGVRACREPSALPESSCASMSQCEMSCPNGLLRADSGPRSLAGRGLG